MKIVKFFQLLILTHFRSKFNPLYRSIKSTKDLYYPRGLAYPGDDDDDDDNDNDDNDDDEDDDGDGDGGEDSKATVVIDQGKGTSSDLCKQTDKHT